MIVMTKNNFASFRNIHVFSAAYDMDMARLLRRESQLVDSEEIVRPKSVKIVSKQLDNCFDVQHQPQTWSYDGDENGEEENDEAAQLRAL